MFDKHRIICRIDNNNRYHEVDELKPNPPNREGVFHIESIPYWFDHIGQLWYNLSGEWYLEVVHTDLASARSELARCAGNSK
jgi:hypothetical protein